MTPKIKTFRDIKPEIDKLPKDQPVYTYCTGDIRCEYLSAYMKNEGFKDVYHLEGGIVKYGKDSKTMVYGKVNATFSTNERTWRLAKRAKISASVFTAKSQQATKSIATTQNVPCK